MKKLILVFVLMTTLASSQNRGSGIGFNKVDYFAIGTYTDVGASFKEHGLDAGVTIEYIGPIYAKASLESFAVLPGGYFHASLGVGTQITHGWNSEHRLYMGFRATRVFRNGAKNTNPGLEIGYDYALDNGLGVGVRFIRERRYDMLAFQWPVINRNNYYIRLFYRWDYKGRGFERK